MGSLITPSAIVKKFLGFDEGIELNPSFRNFRFAWREVNPMYFWEVRSVFNKFN
jgi:hypothetical protein